MSDRPEDPRKQLNVNQEAVSGVNVGRNLTIGNITQIHNPLRPLTPEERTEKGFRKKLLTTVYNDWLYILEEKLSSKAEIELALETRSDLVKNPFTGEQEKIDKPAVDTEIENIFAQWQDGQRLLILGNPGSGKTRGLLQLAKKFYNRARKNVLEEPIPVVFHLSSWKYGQSITEWLIQQFYSKYGFPQEPVETWVKNRNLFLFLDGLDRVNTVHQQDCVKEINKFGASDIVVCSRIQQYKRLPENVRLTFDRAVCIKPLTRVQINNYLKTLNKLDLKKVLDEDNELLKLAKIPFWLDIITDVHKNLPREGSSKERKKKLFDEYIEITFKKFDRTNKFKKYDKKKVIKWLTWLASKSESNKAESVFLIEEMQPLWLTKKQKKLYLIAILLMGMFLGLLFGPLYGGIIISYISFSWGESLGFLVNLIISGFIYLGIPAGIIIGTLAQYFLKVHELPIKTHKEVYLSWEKARHILVKSFENSIYEASGIAVLVVLFCLLTPILPGDITKIDPMMGLIVGAFFGLVTLIARLSSNSLVDKKEVKTLQPNQGIFDSLKNLLLIARNSSIVLAIFVTLIIIIIHKEEPVKLTISLILGLFLAGVTGVVTAFIHHSGRSCQQHLALRIVLYLTGSIPWNYANFLNYASQLSFLNKIGGGYQFFPEMFRKYLVSSEHNQRDG